ncbi:MAG: ferredoxin [Dongiaceae bacterium]
MPVPPPAAQGSSSTDRPAVAAIVADLAAAGLAWRGGFHPAPQDGVPALPGGRAAATLILAGTVGSAWWADFAPSPEARDGAADPLDRWSRRLLTDLAARHAAAALFPFGGPPYLPFQRWAGRAEPVAPSPLGILIHPEYGLWHAYRGALAFAERLALPAPPAAPNPCASCRGRPCLEACPVGAFAAAGYDVARCVAHLDGPAGGACVAAGCQARLACPVGSDYRYAPAAAGFHMAAFLRARRGHGTRG